MVSHASSGASNGGPEQPRQGRMGGRSATHLPRCVRAVRYSRVNRSAETLSSASVPHTDVWRERRHCLVAYQTGRSRQDEVSRQKRKFASRPPNVRAMGWWKVAHKKACITSAFELNCGLLFFDDVYTACCSIHTRSG